LETLGDEWGNLMANAPTSLSPIHDLNLTCCTQIMFCPYAIGDQTSVAAMAALRISNMLGEFFLALMSGIPRVTWITG
jgi:hypothetical protein